MAEFGAADHGIGLTMEITVAPEDDVEIRRISAQNHTDRVRRIALTSYGEVILAPQAPDCAPCRPSTICLSKAKYVPDTNALIFGGASFASEELIYLAHAATVSPGHPSPRRV